MSNFTKLCLFVRLFYFIFVHAFLFPFENLCILFLIKMYYYYDDNELMSIIIFNTMFSAQAFSSLLMVLVASLACWTLCALYSLKIATSNQQRHKKPTTPTLV